MTSGEAPFDRGSELPAADEWLWRSIALVYYAAVRAVLRSRWTASGGEHLAALDGPFLLASNHCSHVDTPVLQRTVPARCRARLAVLAAHDVFGPSPSNSLTRRLRRWIVTRFAVAGHRAMLVKRSYGSPENIRRVLRLLEDGWSVIIYPEGTRSRDGTLGPFRSGVAALARRCQRPVVPAWIEGSARLLPIGTCWPGRSSVRVRFGAPLVIGLDEDDERFTQRLRDAVNELGGAERAA